MTLPVELDPRAEDEARAAFRWYLERSPQAAVTFEQEFENAIKRIGEEPTVHHVLSGELRRYLFDRFPYALIYALKPTCVRVIAVAHQHRRPGYWKRR